MTETLTLHAAIERVLTDDGRPMTTREIADIVNAQRLYVRGDDQPVPPSQVSARIRNYRALFNNVGDRMTLLDNGAPQSRVTPRTEHPARVRQPIDRSAAAPLSEDVAVGTAGLFRNVNLRVAGDVVSVVPERPGVYAIRVIDFAVLPEPFRGHAERRNDRLVYIGEAKNNLRRRLGQELLANGHGTFFRSLGAVIGYRPARGSLADKANKNNYTFVPDDEAAIIRWITDNLEVSWLELDGDVHETEVRLIHESGPLLISAAIRGSWLNWLLCGRNAEKSPAAPSSASFSSPGAGLSVGKARKQFGHYSAHSRFRALKIGVVVCARHSTTCWVTRFQLATNVSSRYRSTAR